MSAKTIMLQGTMSHVGKTILTAGLCRLFSELGYRTAPFKAQNLSSKGTVLADGSEIGTGQAIQARAAGIIPVAAMNPLLLKANMDGTLDVFLHGKKQSRDRADYYFFHRNELMREILSDFNELREKYDIICIEGAGSPAEPNLQQRDIANMGLAREIDAPVLLVGDIERGGVFASLYGTLMLLSETDRKLVKGLIINKFTGEERYLQPALGILEEKTGLPVLGIIPCLSICLEEEDVSFSRKTAKNSQDEDECFRQILSALRAHLKLEEIMNIIWNNK